MLCGRYTVLTEDGEKPIEELRLEIMFMQRIPKPEKVIIRKYCRQQFYEKKVKINGYHN